MDRFKHLDLPIHNELFERRKRRAFPKLHPRTSEEKKQYYEVQIEQFGNIKEAYQRDKDKLRGFFDPNLIFKIEASPPLSDDKIRMELERMNIQVIASPRDKTGAYVVFSGDEELNAFKEKLKAYSQEDKYKFIDGIGTISEIPPDEKIGIRLSHEPLRDEETTYLDVEIWRMEDSRLNDFLQGFKKLMERNGGLITDKLITKSVCLVKVKANQQVLGEIVSLREVASVDRPPQPYIDFALLATSIEKFMPIKPPNDKAAALAVLDSGILSNHPLLQIAVANAVAIGTKNSSKIKEDKPFDDVGHGTQVSGIALYGDVKACAENKQFVPEIWILSIKIMHAELTPNGDKIARYEEDELLEHQLDKAIHEYVSRQPNCKVVNLSLGDDEKRMFGNRRQFNLAMLIDDLAKEFDLIFVIPSGNLGNSQINLEEYPEYLIQEDEQVKIIDPSSAALALTVGSLAHEYAPLNRDPQDISFSPARKDFPSPFTRVGLGYKQMIKPDLVEYGGNSIYTNRSAGVEDPGGKLVTVNPTWLEDGKLFTLVKGSSFAAPKIAHQAAKLFNQYPEATSNFVKALLIASAEIPEERPSPLNKVSFSSSDTELANLLKIYGYGKPNFQKALYSTQSDVLLLHSDSMKLNSVRLYYFYLPDEYVNITGKKGLSVTLVFNPLVNKNRKDYLGCLMEFHLFSDMEIEEVSKAYKGIKIQQDEEEVIPEKFEVKEIKLRPGINLRKRGVHQKGIIKFQAKGKPDFDLTKPLVLAVVCQDRWIRQENYLQEYSVIVSISHQGQIDLYNKIRDRIKERVRVRA